jgi:hypothetical protein
LTLLAIDPGARSGFAVFEGTTLVWCGISHPGVLVGEYVIEKPEYRKHERVDPNDLITLAIRVGEWRGRAIGEGADVRLVTPMQWKGAVPKSIHHPRILASLEATERTILHDVKCAATSMHNVIDAIGIGLFAVGRRA